MKRPQKFETISHLIWHLLSTRQIKWEIVSKFVAFLENLNFKNTPSEIKIQIKPIVPGEPTAKSARSSG